MTWCRPSIAGPFSQTLLPHPQLHRHLHSIKHLPLIRRNREVARGMYAVTSSDPGEHSAVPLPAFDHYYQRDSQAPLTTVAPSMSNERLQDEMELMLRSDQDSFDAKPSEFEDFYGGFAWSSNASNFVQSDASGTFSTRRTSIDGLDDWWNAFPPPENGSNPSFVPTADTIAPPQLEQTRFEEEASTGYDPYDQYGSSFESGSSSMLTFSNRAHTDEAVARQAQPASYRPRRQFPLPEFCASSTVPHGLPLPYGRHWASSADISPSPGSSNSTGHFDDANESWFELRPNSEAFTGFLNGDDADRKAQDDFLIAQRRQGKSYKEIQQLGGFGQSVSTLRGRYRNLTKEKKDRVRRPQWAQADVSCAVFVVGQINGC
jgi:hypothetical protein